MEVLEKSVVEKLLEKILEKRVGRSVAEKCWRRELWRCVVEKRGRRLWQRSVGEECCIEVLEKNVGISGAKRCLMMSGIKVLLFNFSCILAFNFCWIPLLVETLQLHLCLGAFRHVYCIVFRYSLHFSSLQSSRTFHLSNCLLCFPGIRRLVVVISCIAPRLQVYPLEINLQTKRTNCENRGKIIATRGACAWLRGMLHPSSGGRSFAFIFW